LLFFGTVALCLLTSKPAATAVIQSTALSLINDLGFTAVTPSDDLTDLEAPAAMVCPQETAASLLVKIGADRVLAVPIASKCASGPPELALGPESTQRIPWQKNPLTGSLLSASPHQCQKSPQTPEPRTASSSDHASLRIGFRNGDVAVKPLMCEKGAAQ
jgi:hypothetical protein